MCDAALTGLSWFWLTGGWLADVYLYFISTKHEHYTHAHTHLYECGVELIQCTVCTHIDTIAYRRIAVHLCAQNGFSLRAFLLRWSARALADIHQSYEHTHMNTRWFIY